MGQFLDPDKKHWCMDHVYPLALGGVDERANMVKSCWKCNDKKWFNLWRPIEGTITAARTLASEEIATRGPNDAPLETYAPGYRPPVSKEKNKPWVVPKREKKMENELSPLNRCKTCRGTYALVACH